MKLILKAKTARERRNSHVRIGKTAISLSPEFFKKMGVTHGFFGAFGYDEEMKLSLFISIKRKKGFFKLTTSGKKGKGIYIPISKRNENLMKDFIGSYMVESQQMKEDILIVNISRLKE